MAGFAIRRWDQTTQEMINWIQANPDLADGVAPTDLNVGSLERSHLEAVAVALEDHEVRIAQAIQWAVPEACFHAFGFDRLPAQPARGGIRFYALVPPSLDITIPLGTQVMNRDGIRFVTQADVVFPTGGLESPEVAIQAVVSGPSGNLEEGAITTLVHPITGVDYCSNSARLQGGHPEEGDDARQERFRSYLRTLVRGTNAAIEFAALQTGYVGAARCVDPWDLTPPPENVPYAGQTWLFLDDGTGSSTLDPIVMQEVGKAVNGYVDGSGDRVPGWKAAGIRVRMFPVPQTPVKVRAKVTVAAAGKSRWAAIKANLDATLASYFSSLTVAQVVSYQNLAVALTLADEDVQMVQMAIWLATDDAPGYSDPLSAEDVDPKDLLTAEGYGRRATAVVGTALENGTSVTYPEWILL